MTTLPTIDIGANLTHKSFNKDRDEVLDGALEAGVEAIVLTGTSADSSQRAHKLAKTRPGFLYATAGVHPHDAATWSPEVKARISALLYEREVVAVGECGLDFNRMFSPQADQERAFEAQLELSSSTGLPLFLHQRDAHARFLEMIKAHRDALPLGVVHCFTDSAKALHDYLDQGLYIGITGWVCDERRGKAVAALVPDIPEDRLMIETDAPFLAPRTLRPRRQRNEPRFLPHILGHVSRLRGVSPEALAPKLVENTRRFFSLG